MWLRFLSIYMPDLINANPIIYEPSKLARRNPTLVDEDDDIEDPIDEQEIFGKQYFCVCLFFLLAIHARTICKGEGSNC